MRLEGTWQPEGEILPPPPANEPVLSYAPGTGERESLQARLKLIAGETRPAPMVIGGKEITSNKTFPVRAPHDHSLHLATCFAAEPDHVHAAIRAANDAAPSWSRAGYYARAAIFLKAAELVSGPYRDTLNAATMLGQSKSVYQAEIDSACELADFLRFNAFYAHKIAAEQPFSDAESWNVLDYRPLDGFVLALTPFNFTSIAGNLPAAPALMGNTVVWKPSEKQVLAAQYLMELFQAAGLPPGVINLVHGDGAMVSDVAMADPSFAGLHFTGSTQVLRELFVKATRNLESKRAYPRIVGESGGKDFVVAHPSADLQSLIVALGRGAFEYQGQKCSAVSRAYIPRSLWPELSEGIVELSRSLPMGDVADFRTFMGAVISREAFAKHARAIASARDQGAHILTGGNLDDSKGWFVEPTILETQDPRSETMVKELFGPILSVFVYDDANWDEVLSLIDQTSPYALTGSVFAQDRQAVSEALAALRGAAGNFYINDKPTGAVVGKQPFGGSRASGTNDKAGSMWNLIRWTSPRAIKETFVPAKDWRYPHMA